MQKFTKTKVAQVQGVPNEKLQSQIPVNEKYTFLTLCRQSPNGFWKGTFTLKVVKSILWL